MNTNIKNIYNIKFCNKCNSEKEFTKGATSCRECRRKYSIEYRKKYKDKIKERQIKRNKNGELTKYWRNFQYKRKYGITLEDYDKLIKNQNYVCAICGSNNSKAHTVNFHVDHCHITKKVRGLLCSKCNLGLGYFDDDIVKLSNAIIYLNNNKK